MELYLANNKNLRKILKPGCKFYTFCNWSLHLLKSTSHQFLHQNFGFVWQLNQKIKKAIKYTFM